MPAYLIAHLDVHDAALFEQYRVAVPAVIEQFGGHYIVRGGGITGLEGPAPELRIVIVEFPSREAAQDFYDSPAYQPLLAMRTAAAGGTVVIADGA